MRFHQICELQPSHAKEITNSKWTKPDSFIDYLEKNGYKELGSGINATTYAQPNSNAIVKVSRIGDVCWINFAKYVEEHPSPYYPKIKQLKIYGDTRNHFFPPTDEPTMAQKYFVCFMERLQPFTQQPNDMTRILAAFMYETLKNLGISYHLKLWAQHFYPHAYDKEKRQPDHQKVRNLALKFKKMYPDFETAITNLKHINVGRCGWDLHPGNIMWRPSNHTWVIIDPSS